jgi:tartrate-resistant acid phosphatase type 5
MRFAIWLLVVGVVSSVAQNSRIPVELGRVTDKPSLHVVALGDFGDGSNRQKSVAKAIEQRHKQKPFDFGLTLGDNFYRCGVRSVEDPLWKSRWEDLYGTPLGIPFYAALGNHDYGHPPIICPGAGSSPDSEVAYSARSKSWRMPSRYYSFEAGPALFVVADTEGWSDEQLRWIRQTLLKSKDSPTIRWRIVIGHHPLFTSGTHLNERRIGPLREQLFPVLKEGNADLYLGGHDHDLEHLVKEGIHFVICGGGGAHLRGFRRKDPASVFQAVQNAFLDLRIDANELVVQFIGADQEVLENPPLTLRKR